MPKVVQINDMSSKSFLTCWATVYQSCWYRV